MCLGLIAGGVDGGAIACRSEPISKKKGFLLLTNGPPFRPLLTLCDVRHRRSACQDGGAPLPTHVATKKRKERKRKV
jgi:hypothetical protein